MLEYDEGEDDLPTLSRPVIRVLEHSAQGAWRGVNSGGCRNDGGIRQTLFNLQR